MASLKTNFAVGLFMIIGIIIVTAVVIFVGATTYLKTGRLYSTFFDESIQGLSKDSPVKYRGVSIGQVHDIRIAKDTPLVEVLLRVESEWEPDETIIAQLKSIGITGIMYVELDVRQTHETGLYPGPDYKTEHPVIPTRSSDINQLLSGIERLVQQIKTTDFHSVAGDLQKTIGAINQTIEDAQIKKLSAGLDRAITQANLLLADQKLRNIIVSTESASAHLDIFSRKADSVTTSIEKLITDNENDIDEAIGQLRDTLKQANILIKNGTGAMNKAEESISRIEENLIRTINHLECVSEGLKTLTDRSATQPSLLFFAAPPPDKTIEPYD